MTKGPEMTHIPVVDDAANAWKHLAILHTLMGKRTETTPGRAEALSRGAGPQPGKSRAAEIRGTPQPRLGPLPRGLTIPCRLR